MGKDNSSSQAISIRDIDTQQWRSGIAAWLGWMFDGLDMHLYTLVALPFVAQLLGNIETKDPQVTLYSSVIQGSFLFGWALGGAIFGVIGDRIGRSRALALTILTYALFTGLSFFAQTWWHLMIFRFVAALGIGGEWAVGASLIAETWPRKWRPWIAAVLQTGVNLGILAAVLASYLLADFEPRYLFLVGVVPAVLVLWIRRAVPEPQEWHEAQSTKAKQIGIGELFRGPILKVTLSVMVVCAVSLTAHWAFMFWHLQHIRNLSEVLAMTDFERNRLASTVLYVVIGSSIVGSFATAWVAKYLGYRATIGWTFLIYFGLMMGAYSVPRSHQELMYWFPFIGFCQGIFALFTMYLPPLFPTLIRTTAAGFCYNIGRIAAGVGTVFFGCFSKVGDHRMALLLAGILFLPAAIFSWLMPRVNDNV